MNKLYFGDNLDVLREYIPDESVDLVYLDPPFNSQVQYNVLFRTPDAQRASAQAGAFKDTWVWGNEAEISYAEMMRVGGPAARVLDALRSAFGETDMLAYLAMMAIRLHALHRKLRPSGSLYLHCDPVAAHYLKIMLDGLFRGDRCRAEIIWKRSTSHGNVSRNYGALHDCIFFYTKGTEYTWNQLYHALSDEYVAAKFGNQDPDGRRWQSVSLRNPGIRKNLQFPYTASNGVTYQPHPNGWAVGKERLEAYDREGRLHFPRKEGGQLRVKQYLDERPGIKLQDVWTDIPALNSQAQERLGYPTQKPLALLERIVGASSREGEVVLDPFCGCGTTIEAAQRLERQWIGIDIAIHSIKVIEARLSKIRGSIAYSEEGMPRDFASAKKLAESDKYQFQWWANYLFNPHALREQKKGADRGVDGELFFPNGPGRPWGRMLTSVKGGENVGPAMVRDFARVIEREGANLGLFICLNKPTRAMSVEAASVRVADTVHGDIPKLQIVSIEEWFEGKRPMLPPLQHLPSAAFAPVRRVASQRPDLLQPELPLSFAGGKKEEVVRHFNLRMVTGAAGAA